MRDILKYFVVISIFIEVEAFVKMTRLLKDIFRDVDGFLKTLSEKLILF
jgi:hypothetical protein